MLEVVGFLRLVGKHSLFGVVLGLAALGAAVVAGLCALLVFAAPTWAQTSSSSSSDPGRIVFVSNRNAFQADVYTMKPDGTDVRRVTNLPGDKKYPAISPDGRKIAFYLGSSGSTSDKDIYTVDARALNAGSGEVTNLTNTADLDAASSLTWSPEGNVVFSAPSSDGSKHDVYEVTADGTGSVSNLTDTPDIDETQPAMSPDGKKIAYYEHDYRCDYDLNEGPNQTVWVCSGAEDIYTINTDKSGEPKNLTNTPSTARVESNVGDAQDCFKAASPETSGLVCEFSVSEAFERDPTWSADSQQIAYEYEAHSDSGTQTCCPAGVWDVKRLEPPQDSRGVYRTNASDGSAMTLVANSADTLSTPSFSPDSTELVLASNDRFGGNNPNDDWDIQKFKADGSAPTTPLNLTEGARVISRSGLPTTTHATDQYPQWGKTPPPDETAPKTTITATTSDNESYTSDTWTNKDVTITLKAADEEGGMGIKSLYYKTEGAHQEEQTLNGTDSATINISEEGVTTVTAYATDKAGNVEDQDPPQVFTIKVDKTAPSVASTVPNNEDKGVSRTTPVTVSLPSEAPIDLGTVPTETFQLFAGNSKNPLKAQVSVNADGHTVTLTPPQKLDAKTKYTAKLKGGPNGVKDLAGNELDVEEYVWSFTTGSQ